jgi:hypothetical protein
MNRNLEMLRVVAGGFQHLRQKVVFVGGASVALYATETVVPESRIDIVSTCLYLSASIPVHLTEESHAPMMLNADYL